MNLSIHPKWAVIVIGSGIPGGCAAKELSEEGLKFLMLSTGKHVE
jgi:choline dehydrogenase-like flavoprotein